MHAINKTARFTGFLYLLLLPLGILGVLYVPSVLFVSGDVTTTAGNIAANEALFRLGIFIALVVQLVYMLLGLFFYKLLRPVNHSAAALMATLVLVAVPIAMLNELNNFAVLQLLSGTEVWAVYSVNQLQAMMSLFLELHDNGIVIAQIFWGLWLFPLGYLVIQSGYIPRILGMLIIISGCGYVLDAISTILFADFSISVSQFTFVGELLLPLWLVVKGVDVDQWEKRVHANA